MTLMAGDIVDLTYTQSVADASFYIVTDCGNVSGSCVVGADAASNIEVIHYVATAPGVYYLILDCYGTNTGGPWTLVYNLQCPAPTGACCNLSTGECAITTAANCVAPSIYLGDGTVCTPNPCPQPPTGACCHTDGTCTMLPEPLWPAAERMVRCRRSVRSQSVPAAADGRLLRPGHRGLHDHAAAGLREPARLDGPGHGLRAEPLPAAAYPRGEDDLGPDQAQLPVDIPFRKGA